MSPLPLETPKQIQGIKMPKCKPLAGKVLRIALRRMLNSQFSKLYLILKQNLPNLSSSCQHSDKWERVFVKTKMERS